MHSMALSDAVLGLSTEGATSIVFMAILEYTSSAAGIVRACPRQRRRKLIVDLVASINLPRDCPDELI